jgi:pimeloyl-ACP methyl ester carboxylesterase
MIAILPAGLELAYDDAGNGIPLLFIHGWPHNKSLWAAQLSGLPTHARCLAPDLRGFGDSSVEGPYSIDQYADDLAGFLTCVGVERAVVCGLSMGGYVALSMLRRHRTRIRALILTSTRATADSDDGRQKRLRMIEFAESRGIEALAAAQLAAMVGETTFSSRPDIVESLRQLMAGAPAEGVIGGQRAMSERVDNSDILETIDFPTLVISGDQDTITPPEELRALARAIPNSKLQVIPTSGHVCCYEKPAAFNHVVGEFLAQLAYD